MPSASDFFNQIKGINARLDDVNGKLDLLRAAVEHVDQTLQWGLGQLITLGLYTNQALYHNDEQNDTIICILEHISRNTCSLLNEAHLQTGLQTVIQKNTTTLAELYAATHAEAALARERLEALRKQVEECCPPEPPRPVCQYEPCPKPEDTLDKPPQVDPRPPGDGGPIE